MKNKLMRNIIISLIMIVAILLLTNCKVYAAGTENVPESAYTYVELEDGTVQITDFDYSQISYNTSLKIPSTLGGKTVTKIGARAFYFVLQINELVIPDTVKEIGSYAFYYCSNLESITLGNSVETIGSYAFSNETRVTSLDIPSSVKDISYTAFLESGISSFSVATGNTTYTSIDGIIFSKDKTKIILCPQKKEIGTYTIPNTVTTIESCCFAYNSKLTGIVIPDSVKEIKNGAFLMTTSLASVTMGSGVEKIESQAFTSSTFTTLNIPAKLTDISEEAFIKCMNLQNITVSAQNPTYTSVDGILFSKDKKIVKLFPTGRTGTYTIPNTVTEIGTNAFLDARITGITIPQSVTTLGDWCFGRTLLKSVVIPETVTKMGNGPFTNCEELTTVEIKSSCDLPYSMFSECTKLSNVKLNDNIKNMGSRVFYKNTALKSITLPANLETMNYTFLGCTNLSKVVIPSTVTFIGSGTFEDNTIVDISNTKLKKLADGAYAAVNTAYVKGTFDYNKAYEVLDLVNQERAKLGRSELKMDEEILEDAMIRAVETSILFDHTRTDSTDCFTINSRIFAENIAASSTTASGVMNQWMNSAGHKSNILNSSWKSVGIGCFNVNGIYYWVQCFSSDTADEPSKKPTNVTKTQAIDVMDDYIEYRVDTASVSLNKGQTKDAKKMYTLNTGWTYVKTEIQPQSFEWTSSNPNVATVDKNGKITGVGGGTTTITAKFGEKTISYQVTVTSPLTSISLNKSTMTVEKGKIGDLSVIYNPTDTTDSKTVTWSTSNPNIATVTNGKVTAVGTGTATITAKVGNKTAKCQVTVTSPLISISLNRNSLELEKGSSSTLNVSYNPSDTTDSKTVIWSTSNSKVATVTNGKVTAVAEGTATITAKVGSKTATCKVTVTKPVLGVEYYSHIQDRGWEAEYAYRNGETSGLTGIGLKVEAIHIRLRNAPSNAKILYKSHVQDIGWESWKSNGVQSGTTGQNKKVEAIRIKLENMPGYSVMYRAYVEGKGWQGWVCDGIEAGTTGKNLKLEAIQIKIVKTSEAPTITPGVQYYSHIQDRGWEDRYCKVNGDTSGLEGVGLKVEAIMLQLTGVQEGASIEYKSHVQDLGWEAWKKDGETSGTTGQNKKIEAIRIRLKNMPGYSVMYRAYVEGQGWQDWVSDGVEAGTTGKNLKLEAIQVKIVKSSEAPEMNPGVQYYSHIQDRGWEGRYSKSNGATSGLINQGLKVEAIMLQLTGAPEGASIEYQAHVQDIGWEKWVKDGAQAGTTGQNKKVEALKIKLTNLPGYSVMYRAYVEGQGWQDWVKDGETAGTTGKNLRMEAIEIKIVKK